MRFNFRFAVRAFVVFLALLAIALTILSFLPSPILRQLVLWAQALNSPLLEATPPAPIINAPRGDLPTGAVGLIEYVQRQGTDYTPVGCGFILRLPNGDVIGVTTAHSVGDLQQPGNALNLIALAPPGQPGQPTVVFPSDTLYGRPGIPRTGDDLTVDWILLKLDPTRPVDPALILTPDPRGAPQPGERVSLFSGRGEGGVRTGTVQSVDANGVWALMDENFDAGGMSGSPFLSQHTGQVVGMAIAVDYGRNRMRIGVNPIGSLVAKAAAATGFPKIADYP